MKKFNVLLVAMIILILGAACKSSPSSSKGDPNVPDWIDELPGADVFWGIGVAKMQDASLALETATARATRDVARQLAVLTQGMIIDHSRQAGTINNPSTSQFAESVGRNLVNKNLVGATPVKRSRMPDGTYWVRVALKNGDAKKAVTESYDNEAARYSEFKAREALKMLDFELNKDKPQPTPVFTDD